MNTRYSHQKIKINKKGKMKKAQEGRITKTEKKKDYTRRQNNRMRNVKLWFNLL